MQQQRNIYTYTFSRTHFTQNHRSNILRTRRLHSDTIQQKWDGCWVLPQKKTKQFQCAFFSFSILHEHKNHQETHRE